MALAAVPPSRSTFSRVAAWDEVIVPSLRKRLENESKVLAKRMSAASIDGSDALASSSTYNSRDRATTPTSSKPSAIPRPSLQQSRTADDSRARSGSFQRNRTVSQPFPFESLDQSPPPLPNDAALRSTSPMSSSIRTTRIPVSRARTGSTSSSHQPSLNGMAMNVRGDSRNGYYKMSGASYGSELTADLWPVEEGHHQPSLVDSQSTLKSLRSGVSELANEKPPFSSTSRHGYDDDYGPRMSTDSEERPFEHWYRGDVSRNGGVGELRVGKRQEMLDIANYGHTLRQASSRTALSTSSRSRSNSRGRDAAHSRPPTRSRAESVGARESIYLDEDEKLAQDSLVLNERPLTDIDTDEEAYDGGEYYEEDFTVYGRDDAVSPPHDGEYHEEDFTVYGRDDAVSPPHSLDRSDTPTLVDLKSSGFKSRIPTPTLRNPGSRSGTPTRTSPPPLEPPSAPKASSPKPSPQATSKPAAATTAAKRRAKSPAATSPAAAKRAKKPPAKLKPTPPKKDDRSRESVAQYPAPDGDDIMHAVPSWTQPVPKSGNWDDVVLPVVARKKGLEDHYVSADGSPKPRPVTNVVEPAPGTFGFDHTKYRGRNGTRTEEIPMNDFGQQIDELAEPNDERQPAVNSTVIDREPVPRLPLSPPSRATGATSPARVESPPPFSQYNGPPPIPEIRVTRASSDRQQKVEMRVEGESEGSGCCRCVIM